VNRIGTDDQIYIAYSEAGADQLRFARRENGSWSFENVDVPNQQVADVVMALDNSGIPVVAYVNKNLERLRLADKRDGNTWQFQTVEIGSKPRDVQLGLSVDSLFLVFYDVSIGALSYTHGAYPDGPWRTDVIDESSSIVGQRPSFVVDEQGRLHVAYLDVLNAKIRYAVRELNGVWNFEDATETQNFTPTSVSLALEQDGTPAIAFRNAASNEIVFARKGGGIWQTTPVDGEVSNIVGQPLKLILDSQDRPWILYNYAAVLDELRLVRRTKGGSWAQVSVLNPQEIANVFDFSLVEQDLYIVGRKNVVGATGLGLLFAEQGIKTNLSPALSQDAFTIFPNPGQEWMQVKLQEGLTKVRLDIYNVQGQQVHFEKVGDPPASVLTLSTQKLTPGVYIVHLQSEQGSTARRWVKMP
ncbi:MAG: T9SS type A sorting domain-containing protein, partial [Bacteroidota bacterium]